jgi:SAM-dependent methyltransferase
VSGPVPFVFEATGETRHHAPATERNRDSIVDVLKDALPVSGHALEIASGTGEHIVHFARCFPQLTWQPSDPDPAALESIAAWREEAMLPNLLLPIEIDASGDWNVEPADAIICINMVHISPWAATTGLFRNASQVLRAGGVLYLYGPYRGSGVPTAQSNEQFDQSLKSRNPAWGLRNVEDLVAEAAAVGLSLQQILEMPANNLSLIFRHANSAI